MPSSLKLAGAFALAAGIVVALAALSFAAHLALAKIALGMLG